MHSETFKFLGGLSRADVKDEDQQGEEGEEGVKERKAKVSDKSVIDNNIEWYIYIRERHY